MCPGEMKHMCAEFTANATLFMISPSREGICIVGSTTNLAYRPLSRPPRLAGPASLKWQVTNPSSINTASPKQPVKIHLTPPVFGIVYIRREPRVAPYHILFTAKNLAPPPTGALKKTARPSRISLSGVEETVPQRSWHRKAQRSPHALSHLLFARAEKIKQKARESARVYVCALRVHR